MTLKSITIGNFKNIAKTTIELDKIIAIVSTNNYGKSNLLEAIRFAFDFIGASPKQRANMMRWTRGIPLSPLLAGNDFIFSIEFDDPTLKEYRFVRYSFKFSWINDTDTGAIITDENIEMRETESVRFTSFLKRDKGQYRAGKSKTGFRKITLAKDILAIDILSALDDIEISDVVTSIKKLAYRMCNTLELDRSFQLNPIEFDFGTNSALAFDDNDIPKALSILKKEYPVQYNQFIETIYDLFPEFKKIELQSYSLNAKEMPQIQAVVVSQTDNEDAEKANIPYHIKDELFRLIIHSSYLNQPISMEYMSTGTKRLIWLIANAVFGNCYGTNLIGVDEIETSIHPKMIRNLLESLSYILDSASMVVTSHSPYLIQYLKPESIYIGVHNVNGIACFKKIHRTKIKNLINVTRELETSIGEYLFELMAGDDDSAEILSAYLED
ncbi:MULTISPECIES: AAA family ATPase [unclassified Ruminococcus]|uniref:AAA family ATPase n=1 Tax=unclassified Ruminococcus TaxID=2608920 RepID=UPI00210DDC70|nr:MULTISPECIES: AAA family ATPase [unclassified Ruminococcus]MCQ4023309.1 AAA family ATPase [Ruminococcus sp. zg-924]MCQ4115676.1 AAA family ATPase [Ruminococcus sp. zg-921]